MNGEMTDSFDIEMGVPQGSILSPFLYSCFINDLIGELKKSNLGVKMGEDTIGVLCYADDIVLIAPDDATMQQLLNITSDFAKKWRFRFNQNKSNVVVFGSISQQQLHQHKKWFLSGKELKVVNEYKYLGLEMHAQLKKWKTVIERMRRSADRRSGMLRRSGCKYGDLSVKVGRHLFRTMVIPIWEFGTVIWNGRKSDVDTLESVQARFARNLLDLPQRATNALACCESGIKSVQARIDELILRWFSRATTVDPNRLFSRIFELRWSDAQSSRGKSSCLQRVKTTLVRYGYEREWNNRKIDQPEDADDDAWMSEVRQKTDEKDREMRTQQLSTHIQLTTYLDLLPQHHLQLQPWMDDLIHPQATRIRLRLRSSTLPLNAVLARWSTNKDPLCPMCHQEPECEQHFLTSCPCLEEERKEFEELMERKVREEEIDRLIQDQYRDANPYEKMLMILGKIDERSTHFHKLTRNYIIKCWKTRCEKLNIDWKKALQNPISDIKE